MIIVRSPLRITLGGGGTDLPSYYREHGGYLVAAAINKYVYVTIMRPFISGIFLKYSEIESVESSSDVKHKIIRECLLQEGLTKPQIEITTLADIPAGTGLGSSGSFTTALIKALYGFEKKIISPKELAEMACRIEIDLLNQSVGKQDQFISAHGGITSFTFNKDDSVDVAPLKIKNETLYDLEDNLLLFFTGFSRSASSVLADQDAKSKNNDREMIENLHFTKDLGVKSTKALLDGDTYLFGELLDVHWQHKKNRSGGMTNSSIDMLYKEGMKNGAVGGKLVGAGGGGFLMFYAADKYKLRKKMVELGLEEVRFTFDFDGAKSIL